MWMSKKIVLSHPTKWKIELFIHYVYWRWKITLLGKSLAQWLRSRPFKRIIPSFPWPATGQTRDQHSMMSLSKNAEFDQNIGERYLDGKMFKSGGQRSSWIWGPVRTLQPSGAHSVGQGGVPSLQDVNQCNAMRSMRINTTSIVN